MADTGRDDHGNEFCGGFQPIKPPDGAAAGRVDPRISLTIYVKTASKGNMATADSPAEVSPVEDARDELQASIPKAAETLTDLLDAEDERVQIRAAEAILDRAGLTKADKYGTVDAQIQIGGGERSGSGFSSKPPLEDADGNDTPY